MGLCSTPQIPDYTKAAIQGQIADVQNYPFRSIIEAAANMGQKVTIDGKTYDFTGLGQADTDRVVSDKMAQTLLDLQREKSPALIQARIDELKAADPQGFAARKDLFDRIMADAQSNPDRPMAEGLQNEITIELQKGGQLDDKMRQQVQNTVRGAQVGRGIYLGNAPTSQEAGAMVNASDAMRSNRQQRALQFLESGSSPEDVEYRRLQQSMANLGDFVNGITPSAQFRSLSGAANGSVPFIGGPQAQSTTDPNAQARGAQNALDIYRGNVNWNNSQVNPWIAGLSTFNSGLSAASNLGWSLGGSRPGTGAGYQWGGTANGWDY